MGWDRVQPPPDPDCRISSDRKGMDGWMDGRYNSKRQTSLSCIMPPVFVLACDLHMDLLLNVMTLDTSSVTLYFVCVNKCQKNSLPGTWLPDPFVWFDLFSQTELKASGATVKILKGVGGRDVKRLIMEPDNMIHRLQNATSPETIKPGDKNQPNVFLHTKTDICTNRIPDSQCTFRHTERVVLWKKTAVLLFFFSPSDMFENAPQLQMTFCCSYPQSLWSLTFKTKGRTYQRGIVQISVTGKFLFPSAFFCAHFKSIASERVDRNWKENLLVGFCVFYAKKI